jgi:hypothetical protein
VGDTALERVAVKLRFLAFIRALCHIELMSMTAVSRDAARPLSFNDLFEFWTERCESFLDWQRTNFVDRDSSPPELAEHTKRLNLMVRFTLHVYAQAADPDAPMPEALATIAGRLKQFEDWRAVIHCPLTEEAADTILARAFPDEAGAGTTA